MSEQQHDLNECEFYLEMNRIFRDKQTRRHKAIYQQAVTASAGINQGPANIADEKQYPALRNPFDALPHDIINLK